MGSSQRTAFVPDDDKYVSDWIGGLNKAAYLLIYSNLFEEVRGHGRKT